MPSISRNDGVSSLAFGTRVLVAGFDSAKISVFRFSPGESKLEAAYELNSNKQAIQGLFYGLALSGDSTLASYGGPGDTCVCVWNIDSDVEERVARSNDHVRKKLQLRCLYG